MKTVTVIKADKVMESVCLLDSMKKDLVITGPDDMSICDGYHTFDELYEHRISLFIALCKIYADEYDGTSLHPIWRSKLHSDNSSFDGWFILGMGKEKGEQITYHLPLSKWDETNFAETLNNAPSWDGHSSNDVLERLNKL